MENQQRVVITGIGVVSSLGMGKDEFWNNIEAENQGITVCNEWKDEPELGDQYFGKLPSYTFKEVFTNLRPPYPLKYSQLAMMGCKFAIDDAELPLQEMEPESVGLIMNTEFGANAAVKDYLVKLYEKGPAAVSPFTFTKTVANCALGDVTRFYKLRGPSSLLLGENSLTYGYDTLVDQKAEVMICGGFDEIRELTLLTYSKHGKMVGTDEGKLPQELDAFFDDEKKLVIGEGSAFLVLENLDHALNRGAKIYAEVKGYSTLHDLECNEFVHDSSKSTFGELLEESSEMIKAEGKGMLVGSSCVPGKMKNLEMQVLDQQWDKGELYFTSPKPRTGETFGASAMISAAYGALGLAHRKVPGMGFDTERMQMNSPKCKVSSTMVSDEQLNYAIVNSVHIGGNSTNIVLERFE